MRLYTRAQVSVEYYLPPALPPISEQFYYEIKPQKKQEVRKVKFELVAYTTVPENETGQQLVLETSSSDEGIINETERYPGVINLETGALKIRTQSSWRYLAPETWLAKYFESKNGVEKN